MYNFLFKQRTITPTFIMWSGAISLIIGHNIAKDYTLLGFTISLIGWIALFLTVKRHW